MSELSIVVAGVVSEPYAASPTLLFDLRVRAEPPEPVHTLALRAQIRIEPQRRTYDSAEEERLEDLFGAPARWGESLRPFLFAHASVVAGGFTGTSEIELPVPCSYDFEVAAARYLHSLGDGAVPLVLLFSGTIFRAGANGLVVSPVPWHTETRYMLPVAVWRELMDRYYPGGGWLRLRREMIDDLGRFKSAEGLPTFDQAIELLLKRAAEEA